MIRFTEKLNGKNLAEVSITWNTEPVETIIDLIITNGGDIGSVYFLMSEDNIRTKGPDARSVAAEGGVLDTVLIPEPMEPSPGCWVNMYGKKL